MINYGHRGDSSNYPENTLLAFNQAIKVGANGIELDVHKTKDNELVVIHDEMVNRTHLGNGYVKEYTLKELKALRCRKLKYRFKSNCYIPTLEEVIDLIKYKNIFLNIEIKNDKVHYKNIEEDVIDLIKKNNLINRTIISSFNHDTLLRCKQICSEIKTGLLYSKPLDNVYEYCKKYKVDALHPSIFLVNEEYIKKAHENNLKVNVYTVNIPAMMNLLISWNVDGIITDCPGILNKILKS